MSSILPTIDRCEMRRVSIQIWTSNSELLFVLVDPFPQSLGLDCTLLLAAAIHADDVCGESVTIASTRAAPVIRFVICGLQPVCNRLAVVIAESACDPGCQSGLFPCMEQIEQL
ncbi:hypothetical protein A6X20_25615 [Bradyrhizobium elkanii]|nr:hypothetical protein A6X20_25615 [Bradyrhizobium elkanii]ODM81661.1 hypothetical protein A6452_23390 [Bradyrhizobium elkanii]